MGLCLAEEAADRGAEVVLIIGRTCLRTTNRRIRRIDVMTADEMFTSAMSVFEEADVAILAAAVADFTPVRVSNDKIKKESVSLENGNFVIELKRTKDILATMGNRKHDGQLVVGFALETENIINNAKAKLNNKKADFIVVNNACEEGAGFGVSTNRISIIDKFGTVVDFGMKSKIMVAKDILDHIGL